MTNIGVCGNCLFFELIPESQGASGECRRYPPRAAGQNTQFPVVNENDYCGEFMVSEQAQVEPPTPRYAAVAAGGAAVSRRRQMQPIRQPPQTPGTVGQDDDVLIDENGKVWVLQEAVMGAQRSWHGG